MLVDLLAVMIGNSSSNFSQNYNMGQIFGNNYKGGIAGYRYRGSISSCYYETGTADYGTGNNGNTGCTSASREEIVSSIIAMNEYKADEYNINEGYPILTWQTDNDKLNLINGDNAFVEDTQGLNNGYPILAWELEARK